MNSSSGFTTGTSFQPSAHEGSDADEWEATRAQTALATQIMRREEDDDTPPERPEIGLPAQANHRELFVSCPPGLALQQQFEHLHPEFIAIHDLATHATRKLLAALADASSVAVQRLVIRRQAQGNTLATLDYVDIPRLDGRPLRLFSTNALDADPAARQGIARALLGFSTLAVMFVGELPPSAVDSALSAFRDAMIDGPWPNRQLLLMPLTAGSAQASQAAMLALSTSVKVRTSPQVKRAADAWDFIQGTWARMHDADGIESAPGRLAAATERSFGTPAARSSAPATARSLNAAARANTPTAPLPMRPMPSVRQPLPVEDAPKQDLLARYVHDVAALAGVVSCCVFDVNSGLELEFAGASPAADQLAMHGKALLAGMSASSRALGMGHTLPEALITFGSHHLLLRAVPGHPGLALHAALDKAQTNPMLVRLQLQRLDALLDGSPRA